MFPVVWPADVTMPDRIIMHIIDMVFKVHIVTNHVLRVTTLPNSLLVSLFSAFVMSGSDLKLI